jgi:hypothetical protein
MAEFITVAASPPAAVICSKAAERLGLGTTAWKKRDIKTDKWPDTGGSHL